MNSFELISNKITKTQKKFNIPIKNISYSDFLKLNSYSDRIYEFGNNTPLVNKGFQGNFNLSLVEHLWSQMSMTQNSLLSESIFDYTNFREYFVSLTSKCFRFNDVNEIVRGSINHGLLFHMCAVTGVQYLKADSNQTNGHIEYFIEFLDDFIDMRKLKISIFQGGVIEKHGISKFFPKDPNYDFYLELSKKYGFKLMETNQETFLALKIYGSPSMWGYRNEFLYDLGDNLLDIGTFEFLNYLPKFDFDKGETTYLDIVPSDKVFLGSVIGLERFSILLEDKKELSEISLNIKLIELVKNSSNSKIDSKNIFLTSEILKILFFVICENSQITKKRRRKISHILDLLVLNIVSFDIAVDIKFLKEYLELCKIYFYFDTVLFNRNIDAPQILYEEISIKLQLYANRPSYRNRLERYKE